ncbi:MAG: hypothetical protein H7122_10250 [Chitinophagaceae bacterium]|nr:hypothetical protein [Chitinophagaceae bacterium]
MKKIVLSLLIVTTTIAVWAQDTTGQKKTSAKHDKKNARRERINSLLRQEEEGEIVFNKQSVFGIKLATDGYGIAYEIGKFKTARRSTLFQLELSEKKHKKEKKLAASIDNQFQINSVVFGKTNNFYQLKLGIAQQQIIGGKGNKNGVAVSAIYGGGLSMGMLKPYYVDVEDSANNRSRQTYPEIVDKNYFELGAAGFTVGWNAVKIRPGAYVKAAMRFDYGRLNETVTAIEVGLGAEFYSTKMSQIIYSKEKQLFFNAYVSLLLGRRK